MNGKKISFSLYFLEKICPLSNEFKSFYQQHVKHALYKKGTLLNECGSLCDKLYFIKKGMIRGYHNIENNEITTWLSTDNELVTSITGFFKHIPASENMQAVEDTYVEYLAYNDFQVALSKFPEMVQIFNILLIEYYIHAENRTLLSRIPSAKGRFDHFVSNGNTFLLNRAPHKFLANMLSMRPETFSRILKAHQVDFANEMES
ncbi:MULTISPECIES: Crp/Fnr family transcriptional regulator [Aestuariibaculum]|uniref:Crp/Fnr family transcriptional regulator n=1 Tax=Aestuariibaculum lutulentum TaxID=2920935 RepID=A0ABS9RPJ9_9FLAO|nr:MULTISPECIES: Crp/Fnr family transcriptional regulator [Aestuariibaculum]MCH4554089.1 Crp/Fnr family transcriptional regulator [Aestuariibaculum lutulentum]MCR8667704.1 Crp/Fnr family transcriptional regulator [Aestuariibaculum sp. M13]